MGRVISDRYEELEQLGQGSQGVVYKVRHLEHKTDLALKVLPSYLLEDGEMRARFEQEAQMMTRLRHRNIARVLGSGRDETLNLHFIVMEYIQGKNLKQHLREKGPLPLPEVLEIARQIAGALAYAHTQPSPIIHRDIKPTNIMLEDFSGRAVVLDFGIAKELGESERPQTRTGVMLGTWKYCAPEQLRHESLSGSADVYSLGMVMYEMYTGTPFFSGLDEHAVLGKVLYDQREHDPYFARQTLPAFVTLITKAIAKSRDKRYRRMADLLNDLEACWWALDDTRTMILSPQSPNARPPDAPTGNIEELDEQIRRLEGERQRHTVTAIHGQVRSVKEQAERGGAQQWAAVLFEQGLVHEAEGEAHSRERQYPQAQQSYAAAIALFTQASEEASTGATAQRLEKVRQDAYTAKADAERAGAHEQTNVTHARALTTLMQADEIWAQQHVLKAEPLYQEARQLFEDARDLAYQEAQRREAEAARAQTDTVRVTALADGIATLTRTLFEEGQANEQQAATALERDDFTQARRFYFAAQQKYEHAQRQAQRAQQRRQEILTLAAQTQAMQRQALAAGQRVQHQESYVHAEELVHQATTLFDAHDYTKAGDVYTQARDLYEAALRAVEQELQQTRVQTAHDAAAAARQRATEAEAGRWFPAAWDDGQKAEDAAQALAAREQWDDALQHYQQVQARWESLLVAALQRQEAERQEALATQAQQLEQMQHLVQSARTAAEDADAQAHAPDDYARAGVQQTEADQRFAQQDYHGALALYEEARTRFAHAREQAQRAALREAAELAQTYMQVAQKAALLVHADTLAAEPMREAVTAEQQADTALTNGELMRARQCYETAQQQYARAETQARTEQQQQRQRAVVAARGTQVTHDRVRALASDLESLPAYQEARAIHQHATALFTANQYSQAEAAYRQARQRYEHVGQVAEQRQITSAHERMRMAQDAAVHAGAPQFCADEWSEAIQATTAAQQHVERGETTQAVVAFQQAQERFTQLRSIAEQRKIQAEERQRQLVLAAQQTAEESRAAAETVEAPQYVAALYGQATQLMDDAQQHLQATRWQEALPLLTQAQELFAKAAESAPREKARQTAEAAREKAVALHQETQKGQGPAYFPERFAEATSLLRKAEEALRQEDFSLAQRGFIEGFFLLQQIRHIAIKRATTAEQQATDLQHKLIVTEPEKASSSVIPIPTSEVPPQPPAVFPQPTQSEQRESSRTLSSVHPANGQVQEQSRQEAPPTIPPPRRVVEPSRSTSPRSTIPPTTLPSGKVIGIGAALLLFVIVGYLLRPRTVDEPKNVATVQGTPPSTPAKTQPHDVRTPTLPPSPLTPREEVEKVPKPKEQAQPTSLVSPSPSSEKETRPAETENQRTVMVTPLSPPAPLPLTIRRAEPGLDEELTLGEGETLPFSVTVDNGGNRTLQYRWTLNGVQQSTDAAWRYQPKFDEAEETPKAVHVVVRDDAGQMVERDWRVRVRNVNRAPTITTSAPRLGSPVDVAVGATQSFSVDASDPDKEGPLTYRWLLDGEEVSTGRTGNWQFRAPTSDGTHQLTVEIHDAAGEKIQQRWDVVVKAMPPSLRWVRFQPKDERVRTQTGQPVEFTALAELSPSARGVAGIQYQWRVNDSVSETEDTGQFRFSEDRAGRYQVSVVAFNAEGIKSSLRKWSLEVRELEPPLSGKSPEEITPDPRSVGRCTNELQGLLESIRRAWETKNVRTLASLGVISRLDMARVAENLKQYQAFRVRFTDVDIQCVGDEATVSFKRVDTIDEETVVHPGRTIFHLEKTNGRWMIRSR